MQKHLGCKRNDGKQYGSLQNKWGRLMGYYHHH